MTASAMLAYPPTHPGDTLPASVYIARLDDLARLLIRLLHAVPLENLGYRERKRLHRTVGKLLDGIARPELLMNLEAKGKRR